MRALWESLHAHMMQSIETLSFRKKFEHIRQSDDVLRAFRHHGSLLEHLHAAGGDPEEKNRILSALIATAQGRATEACAATTLLWLALWPGLDAVYRRLLRHFVSSPEDLVSEITDRLTIGIQRLDLSRVERVAATLIRNIERDIRRALRARWAEVASRAELTASDEVSMGNGEADLVLGLAPAADADAATVMIADLLKGWIGKDAGLVLAVVVHGETQEEAARIRGITHDAARKRYQRAVQRLRIHLEEI